MSRYHRQITFPDIGLEGQSKLSQASVLIVGVGGLGSIISLYLSSMGIGKIGLVDGDSVSLTNLHRQIIYNNSDIEKSKVECAKHNLLNRNETVQIVTYNEYISKNNVDNICADYNIIVDGLDNNIARYIIDAYCSANKKPYIFGGIDGFVGQVSVFNYNGSGSYSNLYPEEQHPPYTTPLDKGVLAILPGVIGLLQANEVLKIVLGYGEVLKNKLLQYDLRTNKQEIFDV